MQKRIVTGATGLIGTHLVNHWLNQDIPITVIGRTERHITDVFGDRVHSLTWQQLKTCDFEDSQCVVNLAGANIGEKRFTEARKQEILQSRVNATHIIAKHLAELSDKAPLFFNTSAIGVYGLQPTPTEGLPQALDEDTPIDYQAAPDFLAKVGRAWEVAAVAAQEAGVRTIFTRFGVVLAREGGVLPKYLTPFKLGLGGKFGTGKQPFSWVTIDDLIRAFDFLLTKDVTGPINIVAPGCVSQAEFAKTLAKVLHRPAIINMPSFILKLMMGKEMAQTLILQGQNVYPQRLDNLGFQFKYPDLESALKHLT